MTRNIFSCLSSGQPLQTQKHARNLHKPEAEIAVDVVRGLASCALVTLNLRITFEVARADVCGGFALQKISCTGLHFGGADCGRLVSATVHYHAGLHDKLHCGVARLLKCNLWNGGGSPKRNFYVSRAEVTVSAVYQESHAACQAVGCLGGSSKRNCTFMLHHILLWVFTAVWRRRVWLHPIGSVRLRRAQVLGEGGCRI